MVAPTKSVPEDSGGGGSGGSASRGIGDGNYRAIKYTPEVVTAWYRPPEIFLGISEYTPQIDSWGVGCIIAEMLLPEALFKPPRDTSGGGSIDIMDAIYNLCGTPLPESMNKLDKNYWQV